MSVIIWTIAAGVIIFSIGLISAIGSRRVQKKRAVRRKSPVSRPIGDIRSDAMNRAASGQVFVAVMPSGNGYPQWIGARPTERNQGSI